MKKLIATSTFSLIALSLSAGAAVAAPPVSNINTGSCSFTDVQYFLGEDKIDATNCVGEIELDNGENDVTGGGDPLLSQLNTLFGTSYNWSFVNKDESTGTNAGLDGFSNTQSGEWSVSTPLTGPFAISLKASTGYAVYLFDNLTEAVSSGVWDTAALLTNGGGGGNQPTLSHFSLFTAPGTVCTEDCGPDTDVPEPGLAIGLGAMALGAIKARKRD